MKRLYIPLLALLLWAAPQANFAQNYDEWWKKVELANRKDQPQTANGTLLHIIATARKSGDTPQLIRALCTRQATMREISPDSGRVVLQEIEAELRKETRPVEIALWQNALGQSLVATSKEGFRGKADTALLRRGVELMKRSVRPTKLLGSTRTKAYAPLFQRETGSTAVYGDDLLSVLTQSLLDALEDGWRLKMSQAGTDAIKREVLTKNLDYYQSVGNRRAAFHVEMQRMETLPFKEKAEDVERIRQAYLDVPDNVAAYLRRCQFIESKQLEEAVALAKEGMERYGRKKAVALENWLKEKETPTLNVSWKHAVHNLDDMALYPGETYLAKFSWRNVRTAEIRFHRLEGVRGDDPRVAEDYYSRDDCAEMFKTLPRRLELAVKHRFPDVPKHRTAEDSVSFVAPKAGVYLVELLVDGKRKELSLEHFYTSYLVTWTGSAVDFADRKTKYVDALTGRPNLSGDHIYMAPRKMSEPHPLWGNRSVFARSSCAQVFTDRAIYRPGQRVEVSGFYHAQREDEPYPVANSALRVQLYDAEGKELTAVVDSTDEYGTFVATFSLPKHGRTGVWGIRVIDGGVPVGGTKFRVEEYKRPSYTVRLDTLPKRVVRGETFTLAGSVRTYNDLPVADARVIIKHGENAVWRAVQFDILGVEDMKLDTLTTDADGRFAHTYVAGEGTDDKGFCHYVFEVEVLAENGETQTAQAHLPIHSAAEKEEKPKLPKVENLVRDDSSRAKVVFRGEGYVYYNLVSDAGKWLESREVEVKDSAVFDLEWKPEYGDGARMSLVSVKNGVLTDEAFSVQRPEPDKRLLFKWNTFRSELQPGQTEEWTLTVTRPDGTPVAANVMARLYDASLDAFAKHDWMFKHYFRRLVPKLSVQVDFNPITSYWYYGMYESRPETSLPFTRWRESMFGFQYALLSMNYAAMEERAVGKTGVRIRGARMAEAKMAAPMAAMARSDGSEIEDLRDMQAVGGAAETESMPDVRLRTNFSETAFFFPRLRTDENGVVALKFTLPESLTQWNFNAFAHDKAMNFGLLNEKIVARKLLMVEPTLPRFLREGDRIEMPVAVKNVSGKPVHVRLFLDLIDAKTEKVVKAFRKNYHLADAERAMENFLYAVPDGMEGLMVRVVAKSDEFSDGEERIIPILSRRIVLTHAVPFAVKRGENYDDKLSAAHRRLRAELEKGTNPEITIDTCRDARSEVAKIVPQLIEDAQESSISFATALYGLELAAALPGYHSMTPEEIEHRRTQAIDRLLKNQTPDGGWSWYPRMQTSPWVTIDVLTLLARIPMLTGKDRYANIREHALKYIDAMMTREVGELRKHAAPSVSELQLRYLYLCRLLKREPNDTRTYLLRLAAKENGYLTMLGKSALAVVFSDTNYAELGKEHLQSVVEHTVVSEEMGRYFDTERALGEWAGYRIPTQVYALEALQRIGGQHAEIAGVTSRQLIDEMQLWLLQSKRTQVWNTSRATADATFALLNAPTANDGLTWGAVSATYALPAAQALQKGNGFTLRRRLEVKRGEQWANVPTNDKGATLEELRVGDAVRWVYTLTADRDFDHVALRSSRPAAFESLNPLSGMEWMDGMMAYRISRDAENEYFIEHLRKGTHTFTEEMRVVRAGQYDAGLATLRCVYAPEFVGNSTAIILTAKSR